MVLAFGLDHIIIWRDRPTDLAATRCLDNTSTARGKASIVVEAGYAGTVEADDVALSRRRDIQHGARSQDAFRKPSAHRESCLARQGRGCLVRRPWPLVPACEAWYVRSRGHENRLCHRLLRQTYPRSPRSHLRCHLAHQ